MNSLRTLRGSLVACAVGAALALTACSSSTGNASVSQQQVADKLKKESIFASLKTQLDADKFDALVNCVAKAVKKDAKGSDLDDYVHGKKSIDDIGGNGDAAENDAKSCAKSVIGTS